MLFPVFHALTIATFIVCVWISSAAQTKENYQVLVDSALHLFRQKRQAGYNYDRPKISFDLPTRPGSSTTVASVASSARDEAGYAYTRGTPAGAVAIGGAGASGYTSSSGSAATTAGATTTGYGSGSQSTAGYSSGGGTGYNYGSTAGATQSSGGAQSAEGGRVSTNAPTYLPPSLSPAVSGDGDNGIVTSGAPYTPAGTAASTATASTPGYSDSSPGYPGPTPGYSGPAPGSATGYSGPAQGSTPGYSGPTSGSTPGYSGPTPGSSPQPTDQYLPPQPAGSAPPGGYPTLSSFVPSAPNVPGVPNVPSVPAQDYLPPDAPTRPTPGAISTPAPTYLPPFL